ncbi:hypothetical protein NQ317_019948 [Molorchus minor]|uniref:Integrase p58-like C-terminal domain-containing protein n=1 Tax=Molorchus minor TaxID=1323400 RepID=A0ABQ9IRI6_9CUCU|nr:hypothetical protein NQ317_019948 [Molorchus minor]
MTVQKRFTNDDKVGWNPKRDRVGTNLRTTPLHPQSDGMVERFKPNPGKPPKDTILRWFSRTDWDRCIPLFLLAYQAAVHESTGKTPASIIFGRELRLPFDLRFGHPEERADTVEDYSLKLAARIIDAIHDERINDLVYRIQRGPRAKMKVVHLERLAPYRRPHEELVDRDDQT